ncbi:MAG TPA: MarR family winged helix-turn-helix transcriptional regulator, partial [Pseudonocardiaceae bacterium]
IQGATLTYTSTPWQPKVWSRRRDPANRRVHVVELTEQGEAAFNRMRPRPSPLTSATAGLSDDELSCRDGLLDRFRNNVTEGGDSKSC